MNGGVPETARPLLHLAFMTRTVIDEQFMRMP